MATSKEQSIQITASSGLSKEEIDKLIKDAELHAEDDKKKREVVDARNTGDALIYSTEKSIKDLGEKVDAATKSKVDEAISRLKKAMEGESASEIKKLTEELTQVSHKLAEAMYKQASQQAGQAGEQQAGEQAGGGASGASQEKRSKGEDDVVDADLEEVKDDKK
jgi:molecular chaperone DnaK